LYNLQKNKELFAGEKGPTSNTYVAKPLNANSSSDDKHNEDAFYKKSNNLLRPGKKRILTA
jgi:hypothetical protein